MYSEHFWTTSNTYDCVCYSNECQKVCQRTISFYRASAVLAKTLCPSVCPSVSPSQVGVLLKRQNIGSLKQHRTIAQGL